MASPISISYYNRFDSRRIACPLDRDFVKIGRASDNDITLASHYVEPYAATLERTNGRWTFQWLGKSDTFLDDRRLCTGDSVDLTEGAELEIFPYRFQLGSSWNRRRRTDECGTLSMQRRQSEMMSAFIGALHIRLLSQLELSNDEAKEVGITDPVVLEQRIEELARSEELAESCGVAFSGNERLIDHISGRCIQQAIISGFVASDGAESLLSSEIIEDWVPLFTGIPEREDELQQLVEQIVDELNLRNIEDLTERAETVETQFWPVWKKIRPSLFREVVDYIAIREVKKQVKDIVFGYGPLEDLLRIPNITEIMVVNSSQIYIERSGVIENSGRSFVSDDVTLSIVQRIVAKVGRRIDKSQPLVDARLPDGSRVNAIIPPLAVSGPCLTIRKFPNDRLTIEDLIEYGSLTQTAARFLHACVVARKNIIISGGTGTGKTTLLNCLSEFIPDKERIVTVEDTAELRLGKEHVVRLESRQTNTEGAGAYSIQDLVRNTLRMRPDRIVVGECRGPEALDMLVAMNTGHDGSLTTIHANSPRHVQERLEILVGMACELPVDSIHRQTGSAIDVIVQLTRMRDGRRRVTKITEVHGVAKSTSGLRMCDLFHLSKDEALVPTGYLPTFMDRLVTHGLLDINTFFA